ncbi:glutamate racemase [Candidatus Woesebacteria bacterium RIFCSPLOWO2_01_FULL_39_23]|uniref:Glutamate racemase n=1 Tax=Candidatus Woesebacteria bacterium RIFCSPHIGHO2_01_FULL_40_22 TaxID=1802499 RepID=A0A1F7YJI5_9BACT|nr:MAG: glutamate racemase [Candidatus Woesebacteria bacterium RBG_16_40_11]OGM27514.1 MAG: glutamate racemase [Candidatus Woesebacteria bacterium RIFCSPHIGHO2_01_FULL_40_22]OGM36106.1 MAG: glutamate racemase [Candidatus Woesebacteria bacterium RIFCSPHIGHO2_12_FULL_38_9]OGM62688.1 MAG: glutamate racemase [Candidatus Woesebacteria bacterium RIFCSPLOWO2_01_FULL_39_23]
MNNSPIGVFDSGLGGLTVVKEIKKVLPDEKIIYLGDTARVPYGTRSSSTVIKFSLENTKFLVTKKVKCIVIACNTSSAWATDAIKNTTDIPILNVIDPAVDSAIEGNIRKIGIIATAGTVRSGVYQKKLKAKNSNIDVYAKACPLFVPLIEEGETKGKIIELVAKKYLSELKSKDIDALILGCTHYPIIDKVIGDEMGRNVRLINPAVGLAQELSKILDKSDLYAEKRFDDDEYYLTDDPTGFINVAEAYLEEDIDNLITKISLT